MLLYLYCIIKMFIWVKIYQLSFLASTSGTEQSASVEDYLTNEEVAKLRRLAQQMIDQQLPAQLEPRQGPGRRRMERQT